MKTSELIGPALDWAVAKAEGNKVFRPRIGRPNDWDRAAWEKDGSDNRFVVRVQNPTLGYFVDWVYSPSTSWHIGGPIIEREKICLTRPRWDGQWTALLVYEDRSFDGVASVEFDAPTPLIAAMRCYVQSRLGDEVEIPEELL